VLNQRVGISDVGQPKPEDGPYSIYKAAVTMLKIPAKTKRENMPNIKLKCIL